MSTHVFLTRFNIPANGIEQSIFSDAWLRERVELFGRHTVPSVRAQDASHVGWLVFLGTSSPSWLRSFIAELEADGLLTAHYLSAAIDPADLRTWIRHEALRVSGPGPVVTSNLDNDDGLAVDYVARMRHLLGNATTLPAAGFLARGLILADERTYLRHDQDNAFPAVLADPTLDSFTTCWSEWHNHLSSTMPTLREGGSPAWLQVIHGRNVSNRVRGRLVSSAPYLDTFPTLARSRSTEPASLVLLDALLRSSARGARDLLRGRAAHTARRVLGPRRFDALKSALLRRA